MVSPFMVAASAAWPALSTWRPVSLPPILFRDARFVVLDKPAGLPVHAGPAGGASVEDFFPQLSRRRDGPWLAHRLDADTAGCLLIALRKTPLLAAQAAFAAGRVRKIYWAVVRGAPAADSGRIEARLLRATSPAGWRMIEDPAGQPAITDWRVQGRGAGTAWLELTPHTGRTHQIRMACARLGCPILGDPVYGDGDGPLQLLARGLVLPELDVQAEAGVPPHMRESLARLAR
jgi:tRNA pseudouridine32 synthase/23S rRNA pseudouridine746 synthase